MSLLKQRIMTGFAHGFDAFEVCSNELGEAVIVRWRPRDKDIVAQFDPHVFDARRWALTTHEIGTAVHWFYYVSRT